MLSLAAEYLKHVSGNDVKINWNFTTQFEQLVIIMKEKLIVVRNLL